MTTNSSNKSSYNSLLSIISFVVLMASFFFALCVFPRTALADDGEEANIAPWHTVVLTSGQTYDVSTASKNTTVYIRQSGTYTLKGASTHMRLVIESGGVNVYLADGLTIDTGIYSYVGSRTAAITVNDMGGTVNLISKPGAHIKLTGYAGLPAIRKEGTTTQLVFSTEDPNNPGTIEATASKLGGAGIGSSGVPVGSTATAGNMVFNSGNVTARAGLLGAGIGGGDHSTCNGITINGGTIIATGGNNSGVLRGGGAGIGGGYMGNGKNITINGGTVTATGGENSAGIGGGKLSSSWGGDGINISITGGTVVANGGYGAAGIGGGWEGNARSITISGGKVTANAGRVSGCGIGGGGGNFYGTGSDIAITGGEVIANGSGNGSGIGSLPTGEGETSITVSGGRIVAQGGSQNGCGIGGGGRGSIISSGNTTSIIISGGTITARGGGGAKDIGSRNSDSNFSLSIIGGSVNANTLQKNPINQIGNQVSKTTVYLSGATLGTKVDKSSMTSVSPAYGMKDVYTLDTNTLYFWLPSGATVTAATTNAGVPYFGLVTAGTSGTLYPATFITLNSNGGAQNGSAFGINGQTSLISLDPPKDNPQTGRRLSMYKTQSGTMVAELDGRLRPYTEFTDGSGAWKVQGGTATLFAHWVDNTYYVVFDTNAPARASHEVVGSMGKQTLYCNTPRPLTSNAYTLAGWEFTGWNTAPDGSGTSYTDGQSVNNLTLLEGATVKLYAQWRPLRYTVIFAAGNGSGPAMPPQEMTYDTATPLTANTFAKTDAVFMGWSHIALGSRLYEDQETVQNICVLDNGVPQNCTLTAEWISQGMVTLVITDNDGPVTGFTGNDITLNQEPAVFSGFVEDATRPGVYSMTNVPAGMYGISVAAGYQTTGKTIQVSSEGSALLYLSYCTVEIEADVHASAWIDQGGAHVTQITKLPLGSQLVINASVDAGYVFESYTALTNIPLWDPDPSVASQTITITGQTLVQAHPRAALYQVVFDGNGGTSSSATPQDFVYDEPQDLFACPFTREGYTFAAWTTTPAWTGTSYSDRENVQNLSSQDGGTVMLYAQWKPQEYYIEYNGNGGGVGLMLPQKCFYDLPSNLEACDVTRSLYHFTGWNTEADGSGTPFANEETILNLTTENEGVVTLWAQWDHDAYMVSYQANGGTGIMDDQEMWSHESERLEPCTYTREGYTLKGWNTTANGSGMSYADGADVTDLAVPGDSITLYAQWNKTDDGGGGGGGGGGKDGSGLPGTGDTTAVLLVTTALCAVGAFLALYIRRFLRPHASKNRVED